MDGVKHTIDVGAALATVATILHWMPDVAALLTAIWYSIRIIEWAGKKIKNAE